MGRRLKTDDWISTIARFDSEHLVELLHVVCQEGGPIIFKQWVTSTCYSISRYNEVCMDLNQLLTRYILYHKKHAHGNLLVNFLSYSNFSVF